VNDLRMWIRSYSSRIIIYTHGKGNSLHYWEDEDGSQHIEEEWACRSEPSVGLTKAGSRHKAANPILAARIITTDTMIT
jgi:hypothetical protein